MHIHSTKKQNETATVYCVIVLRCVYFIDVYNEPTNLILDGLVNVNVNRLKRMLTDMCKENAFGFPSRGFILVILPSRKKEAFMKTLQSRFPLKKSAS